MKRLVSILLVLVMTAALLAGCATQPPYSPDPGNVPASVQPSSDTYVIGVSMNSADQYRTSWLNEFKTLAEGKGHTVHSTNADNNASTQISDIESLVARKPDVIIVTALDSEGIVPAIEACAAANIPVIAIDMPIAIEIDSTVADTQGQNGVIQAQYLQNWLDADLSRVANIGYIVGMYSMEAAMPRMNDFKAIVDLDPRCTWIADKEAGWSGAEAMSITEDWIQAHPDMNVFACMSDEMAIGAIQALVAAGKNMDDVIVMGVDGSDAAKEYLSSGELDCTAARDVKKEVAAALDTAEKICAGQTVSKEVYPEAIFPMTVADVEMANVAPLVIGISMNSADQYRTSWLNEFKAIAEGRGHTVHSTNADNNASTQISDIESLVARKPDVIIVTALDSEGIVPAIEACNAANIPVIAIDMPIGIEIAATVADTQGQNGVIQAQYLQSWLDADPSRVANIGYIVGMYSMEAAMPRMNDFKAIVDTDPRCTWIADKEAGWSGAEAMSITEDWIQAHPDMNVFACMSDEMAIGAIQALVAAGKNMDDVIVMGVDGSDSAKEYLISGELDCTAARDVKKEVAAALRAGESVTHGKIINKEIYPNAIFPMTSADLQ